MSEVTFSSGQWDNYQYEGSTAKIRFYYTRNMLGSQNEHVEGGAMDGAGFYDEIDCTVASNILSYPSFTLIATLNSNRPSTKVFGVLYSEDGERRETLFGGNSGWIVRPTPTSLTTAEWELYQGVQIVNPPPSYASLPQIIQLIETALGTLNDASDVVKGRTFLSWPPAVSSHPEALGSNDPRANVFINVKSPVYGAKGDGATNDTAAINLALAAANSFGAAVYFPRSTGDYLTSGGHDVLSATTIFGDGGTYPGRPFSDVGQPLGASVIRLTTSNAEVFSIGSHVVNVQIEKLAGIANSLTGTAFVRARGHFGGPSDPTNTGSSFNFDFSNLYIANFDIGFDIQDTDDATAGWQWDNALFKRIDLAGVNYGWFFNTSNASNMNIISCKADLRPGGTAIYGKKVGQLTVDNFQPLSDLVSQANAFIYLGVQHNLTTIRNSTIEGPVYSLDTEDSAIESTSSPILLQNNFLGAVRLRHPVNISFQSNSWNAANLVTNNANGAGSRVYSKGDVIRGPGASASETTGSAFGASTILYITEHNTFNDRHSPVASDGHSIVGHLGVGSTLASAKAVATLGTNNTEQSLMKPVLRLATTSLDIAYNFLRDSATGLLNLLATQSAARGFWFNSPIYTPTHIFLTNRSVTDGVTHGTTTIDSATLNPVAGDVGAQVVIVRAGTDDVKVTTVATVGVNTFTVASAPSWSSSGNTIIITKSAGVLDLIGTGSPEGVITANIGSTFRRIDGGAGTSVYVKESGSGSSGWVGK